MARNPQTLFEQYHASIRKDDTQWIHNPALRWSVIALTSVVVAIFIPPLSQFLPGSIAHSSPAIGARWSGTALIAERSFSVLKLPSEYQAECDSARRATPPVYERIHAQLERSVQSNSTLTASRNSTQLAGNSLRSHYRRAWSVLDSLLTGTLVVDTIVQSNADVVLVRDVTNGAWFRVPVTALRLRSDVERAFKRALSQYGVADTLISEHLQFIATLPGARYSPQLSEQERELAVQSIRRTLGFVRRGETIVAPGDLVTAAVAAKIASYRDIYAEGRSARLLQSMLSSIVHALLLCGIVWLYMLIGRTEHLTDNRSVLTIAFLFVIASVQSWLSTLVDASFAPEYLVLLPALAMFIALVYDTRLSYVFVLSVAFIHASIRSGDLPSGLSILVGSLAGIISIRTLQSRYQFIQSILFIAVGLWLPLLATVLEGGISPTYIAAPAIATLVNATVSPLVVWVVLIVLDRVFDVPTDVRLLQLDTLTHPLLVKLRQAAPGTYQHTLNVANLAEHAALAIGANPLLARVGAYFHDIGKIRKPEYFAENQIEMVSKHRELSPWRSAAIIRSHVEEGIELALEYRLPPKVIEFIPTHHGTSLIRHFYALALEEAQLKNQTVDENDFRYSGPKPHTKETAIVMLADVSEAIARIADSPSDIEERLERAFYEKIDDGQLDECPLTFNEITTIRSLFANLLLGMHHQRPEYKNPDSSPQTEAATTSTIEHPHP